MHYATLFKSLCSKLKFDCPHIAIIIMRDVTLILLHYNFSNIGDLSKHKKVGKITRKFWVNSRSRIFDEKSKITLCDGLSLWMRTGYSRVSLVL